MRRYALAVLLSLFGATAFAEKVQLRDVVAKASYDEVFVILVGVKPDEVGHTGKYYEADNVPGDNRKGMFKAWNTPTGPVIQYQDTSYARVVQTPVVPVPVYRLTVPSQKCDGRCPLVR